MLQCAQIFPRVADLRLAGASAILQTLSFSSVTTCFFTECVSLLDLCTVHIGSLSSSGDCSQVQTKKKKIFSILKLQCVPKKKKQLETTQNCRSNHLHLQPPTTAHLQDLVGHGAVAEQRHHALDALVSSFLIVVLGALDGVEEAVPVVGNALQHVVDPAGRERVGVPESRQSRR